MLVFLKILICFFTLLPCINFINIAIAKLNTSLRQETAIYLLEDFIFTQGHIQGEGFKPAQVLLKSNITRLYALI
jgi:hypothetical protein